MIKGNTSPRKVKWIYAPFGDYFTLTIFVEYLPPFHQRWLQKLVNGAKWKRK